VAAIVATTVAVRSDAPLGNGPNAGSSATELAHVAPPYFVALAHVGHAAGQIRTADAVVGSTVTGRIIATIAVPKPYNAFVAVSAAADDRTFVLAAQKLPAPPPAPQPAPSTSPATRFYQLRINPAGRHPAVLSALPLPVLPAGNFTMDDSIALSPDGSKLAVQLFPGQCHNPSGVRVYDLAHGGSRTWLLPRGDASGCPGVNSPSWAADGRSLVLLISSSKPHGCIAGCVQLLDTTTSGGNLMADSKTIFRTTKVHRLVSWSNVLVTPDGSHILIAGMAGKMLTNGMSEFYLPVVYDFTTQSGQVGPPFIGQRDENLFPLWVTANARFFILSRPNPDAIGSVSAAIYGPRGKFKVRLPAQTLNAAW
jgi:hypothetical protein